MNLNQWYAVAYRRINQWLRRCFYNFDTPARRRLYDQKREIAAKDVLTDDEKSELARLNWKLGNGSPYRFTAEQRRRQAEMAQEMMRRLNRN